MIHLLLQAISFCCFPELQLGHNYSPTQSVCLILISCPFLSLLYSALSPLLALLFVSLCVGFVFGFLCTIKRTGNSFTSEFLSSFRPLLVVISSGPKGTLGLLIFGVYSYTWAFLSRVRRRVGFLAELCFRDGGFISLFWGFINHHQHHFSISPFSYNHQLAALRWELSCFFSLGITRSVGEDGVGSSLIPLFVHKGELLCFLLFSLQH